MRTLTFKTKEHHKLQGEIVVKAVKYTERLKLIKECNFKTDASGEISFGFDQVDSLIKAIELTAKFVEKVDLKAEDGTAVSSYDDLEYFQGADTILTELAFFVINGPQLGNS
jgi:hypothetical protein